MSGSLWPNLTGITQTRGMREMLIDAVGDIKTQTGGDIEFAVDLVGIGTSAWSVPAGGLTEPSRVTKTTSAICSAAAGVTRTVTAVPGLTMAPATGVEIWTAAAGAALSVTQTRAEMVRRNVDFIDVITQGPVFR